MDAIIAYLTESDASLQQALQWILEDQPESVLAGSPDACLGAHSGALDARAYILQFSKSRLAQAQGAVGALGDSSVPASPSAVARHPAHQADGVVTPTAKAAGQHQLQPEASVATAQLAGSRLQQAQPQAQGAWPSLQQACPQKAAPSATAEGGKTQQPATSAAAGGAASTKPGTAKQSAWDGRQAASMLAASPGPSSAAAAPAASAPAPVPAAQQPKLQGPWASRGQVAIASISGQKQEALSKRLQGEVPPAGAAPAGVMMAAKSQAQTQTPALTRPGSVVATPRGAWQPAASTGNSSAMQAASPSVSAAASSTTPMSRAVGGPGAGTSAGAGAGAGAGQGVTSNAWPQLQPTVSTPRAGSRRVTPVCVSATPNSKQSQAQSQQQATPAQEDTPCSSKPQGVWSGGQSWASAQTQPQVPLPQGQGQEQAQTPGSAAKSVPRSKRVAPIPVTPVASQTSTAAASQPLQQTSRPQAVLQTPVRQGSLAAGGLAGDGEPSTPSFVTACSQDPATPSMARSQRSSAAAAASGASALQLSAATPQGSNLSWPLPSPASVTSKLQGPAPAAPPPSPCCSLTEQGTAHEGAARGGTQADTAGQCEQAGGTQVPAIAGHQAEDTAAGGAGHAQQQRQQHHHHPQQSNQQGQAGSAWEPWCPDRHVRLARLHGLLLLHGRVPWGHSLLEEVTELLRLLPLAHAAKRGQHAGEPLLLPAGPGHVGPQHHHHHHQQQQLGKEEEEALLFSHHWPAQLAVGFACQALEQCAPLVCSLGRRLCSVALEVPLVPSHCPKLAAALEKALAAQQVHQQPRPDRPYDTLVPGARPMALVGLLHGPQDGLPGNTTSLAASAAARGRGGNGGTTAEQQRRAANRERARDAFFALAKDAALLARAVLGSASTVAALQQELKRPGALVTASPLAGQVEALLAVRARAVELVNSTHPDNMPFLAELFTGCILQAANTGEAVMEEAVASLAQRDPSKFQRLNQRLQSQGPAGAPPPSSRPGKAQLGKAGGGAAGPAPSSGPASSTGSLATSAAASLQGPAASGYSGRPGALGVRAGGGGGGMGGAGDTASAVGNNKDVAFALAERLSGCLSVLQEFPPVQQGYVLLIELCDSRALGQAVGSCMATKLHALLTSLHSLAQPASADAPQAAAAPAAQAGSVAGSARVTAEDGVEAGPTLPDPPRLLPLPSAPGGPADGALARPGLTPRALSEQVVAMVTLSTFLSYLTHTHHAPSQPLAAGAGAGDVGGAAAGLGLVSSGRAGSGAVAGMGQEGQAGKAVQLPGCRWPSYPVDVLQLLSAAASLGLLPAVMPCVGQLLWFVHLDAPAMHTGHLRSILGLLGRLRASPALQPAHPSFGPAAACVRSVLDESLARLASAAVAAGLEAEVAREAASRQGAGGDGPAGEGSRTAAGDVRVGEDLSSEAPEGQQGDTEPAADQQQQQPSSPSLSGSNKKAPSRKGAAAGALLSPAMATTHPQDAAPTRDVNAAADAAGAGPTRGQAAAEPTPSKPQPQSAQAQAQQEGLPPAQALAQGLRRWDWLVDSRLQELCCPDVDGCYRQLSRAASRAQPQPGSSSQQGHGATRVTDGGDGATSREPVTPRRHTSGGGASAAVVVPRKIQVAKRGGPAAGHPFLNPRSLPPSLAALLQPPQDPVKVQLQQALLAQYSTDEQPVKLREVVGYVADLLSVNAFSAAITGGMPAVLREAAEQLAAAAAAYQTQLLSQPPPAGIVQGPLASGQAGAGSPSRQLGWANAAGKPLAFTPAELDTVKSHLLTELEPITTSACIKYLEGAAQVCSTHVSRGAEAALSSLLPPSLPQAAQAAATAIACDLALASCWQRLFAQVPTLIRTQLSQQVEPVARGLLKQVAQARMMGHVPADLAGGAPVEVVPAGTAAVAVAAAVPAAQVQQPPGDAGIACEGEGSAQQAAAAGPDAGADGDVQQAQGEGAGQGRCCLAHADSPRHGDGPAQQNEPVCTPACQGREGCDQAAEGRSSGSSSNSGSKSEDHASGPDLASSLQEAVVVAVAACGGAGGDAAAQGPQEEDEAFLLEPGVAGGLLLEGLPALLADQSGPPDTLAASARAAGAALHGSLKQRELKAGVLEDVLSSALEQAVEAAVASAAAAAEARMLGGGPSTGAASSGSETKAGAHGHMGRDLVLSHLCMRLFELRADDSLQRSPWAPTPAAGAAGRGQPGGGSESSCGHAFARLASQLVALAREREDYEMLRDLRAALQRLTFSNLGLFVGPT